VAPLASLYFAVAVVSVGARLTAPAESLFDPLYTGGTPDAEWASAAAGGNGGGGGGGGGSGGADLAPRVLPPGAGSRLVTGARGGEAAISTTVRAASLSMTVARLLARRLGGDLFVFQADLALAQSGTSPLPPPPPSHPAAAPGAPRVVTAASPLPSEPAPAVVYALLLPLRLRERGAARGHLQAGEYPCALCSRCGGSGAAGGAHGRPGGPTLSGAQLAGDVLAASAGRAD
jgi:hypothetical protein